MEIQQQHACVISCILILSGTITNGRNFYSYLSWEYTSSNAASLAKSFDKTVPKDIIIVCVAIMLRKKAA